MINAQAAAKRMLKRISPPTAAGRLPPRDMAAQSRNR
jgi:hypothetical protein